MRLKVDELTAPQLMWIDVIGAVINLERFDLRHGDMSYNINNMIAKLALSAEYYYLTKGALEIMSKLGIDTNIPVRIRKYIYGKGKPTTLEHLVPAGTVRKLMLNSDRTVAALTEIACRTNGVFVMSREEDKQLSKHGFSRKMPDNWRGIHDDPLKRYQSAGIELSNVRIRHAGPLCR